MEGQDDQSFLFYCSRITVILHVELSLVDMVCRSFPRFVKWRQMKSLLSFSIITTAGKLIDIDTISTLYKSAQFPRTFPTLEPVEERNSTHTIGHTSIHARTAEADSAELARRAASESNSQFRLSTSLLHAVPTHRCPCTRYKSPMYCSYPLPLDTCSSSTGLVANQYFILD